MHLRDLITERDNKTPDPVRLFGVGFALISSNILLGLSIYSVVWLKAPFDPKQFAEALGILWGVTSAAIAGKALTEKPCSPQS